MEQLHNESNQNNTVRNLLIVLLVAVIGGGGFMIYNTVYNTPPASNTTQQNNENPEDTSATAKGVLGKITDSASKYYQSLTPGARNVINGIGFLVGARILYPIFRRKKQAAPKERWWKRIFRRKPKGYIAP